MQSLTALMTGSWARHHFDAILSGGFGVAALLLAVSAGACLVPAWRATRADPVEALQAE